MRFLSLSNGQVTDESRRTRRTAKDSIPEAQKTVSSWMSLLKSKGTFAVLPETLEAARTDFAADRVSDGETTEVIERYFEKEGYVVDPHTAVGLAVAERQAKSKCVLSSVWLSTRSLAHDFHALQQSTQRRSDRPFDRPPRQVLLSSHPSPLLPPLVSTLR